MKSIILAALLAASLVQQQKVVSASKAWIKAPAAGETTAIAFVVVDNPTMYDVYLVSASTDAAGKVQFQKIVGTNTEVIEHLTAPAYDSIEFKPGGNQLLLLDLKRPLKPGDKVWISLATDGGTTIEAEAEVREK
jgi:copper(I)-binding protein